MSKSVFILFFLAFVGSVFGDIPGTHKTALINLSNNCGGSNWVNKWTTSSEVCPSSNLPWFGIVCSGTSSVLEINLGFNNVVGSGSACCSAINGLNILTGTRFIFFSNNQINCPFPTWTSLTALQTIQIQNNLFFGPIPSGISSLTSLTSIIALNNQITGPLPTFPSSLQKLYLTRNNIATAIPTTISNLNSLTALFLGNNSIPGPLPTTFVNLQNLLFVDLSFNQITGSLISDWSPAGSTRPNVNLRFNRLDCRLPSSLATISHVLDLSGNLRSFMCPLPAIAPSVTGISSCVEMRITSVTPNKVPVGIPTTVTLTGINFDQCAGQLRVRVSSGWATFVSVTATQITFVAPDLAFGDKSVQVYFNDQITPASSNFVGIKYIVACPAQCNPQTNPNIAGCDENTGNCICKAGWGTPQTFCNSIFYPCPANCNNLGTCDTQTGLCDCIDGRTGLDCSQIDLDCPQNCNSPRGQCDRTTGRCGCISPWVAPDCAARLCPLNCNGRGSCNNQTGICTCDVNWSGSGCSIADIACPGNCNGRGICNRSTGTCACDLPWLSATNCLTQPCPSDCSGRGTCDGATGVCTCPSTWALPDCKNPYLVCGGSPICTGQGDCNYLTGICVCQENWSPLTNCSTAPCPRDCSGNGQCNINTRVCTCNDGFIGADCSIIFKTCPGTPECFAHGSCNRLTGLCNCNGTYTSATNCEFRSCPDNCYNSTSQGVCNRITGVCECATGWGGSNCNTRNVLCPSPCANGGSCNLLTGTCICVAPWQASTNCTTQPCQGNCNGQGVCNNSTGICACNPTYLEPNCVERDIPCIVPDCSGRGFCDQSTGQCNCTAPWNSLTGCASIECPNDCSQRGQCNSQTGLCACDPGWTGSSCATAQFPCGTSVANLECSGNGNCTNGRCTCNPVSGQPWIAAGPSFCGRRQCPGTCVNGLCNEQTGVCDCYVLSDRFYNGTLCQTPFVFCDDLILANAASWCNANLGAGSCRRADGVCVCTTGYSTASNCYNCTEGFLRDPDTNRCIPRRTCAPTCEGRGTCNEYTGVCSCFEGFTGANCDAFDCPRGEFCNDAGQCYEEICSGVGDCIPIDPDSRPPVTKCKCLPGYEGENCSKKKSSAGQTALAATLGCVAVVAVAGGGLYAARRHAIANYKKKMGQQKEMK